MQRLAWSVLALGLVAACERAKAPAAPGFRPPADSVRLDIPDRQWAPEAPPEGWCGEASIQMAALHYGAWIPQSAINEAGRAKTPDLWETDVPVAMQALGLRFEAWMGTPEVPPFLDWIVASLRRKRPVVLGVKTYPTPHADWDVDHLVLAVGFEPEGLLLDTNWGDRQLTWPWARLQDKQRGYSLVGPAGKTFGFAVLGFEGSVSIQTSLRVTAEDEKTVSLEVAVNGLEPGQRYLLVRDDAPPAQPFEATAAAMAFPALALAHKPVRFTCRAAPLEVGQGER